MKKTLAGMFPNEIETLITDTYNQPKYRAKQVQEWMNKATDIMDMSNLPLSLREELSQTYDLSALTIEEKYIEEESDTYKYLLKTKDGIIIECVLLCYEHGNTLCVSSQAGCRMGCEFCVSGQDGLLRNLNAAEMISQIYCVMQDTGKQITNIVMMGSGEPFDNYEEIIRFIRLINDPDGLQIGIRHITVSTCGIIPGIERLTEEGPYVNLSVSMHSPHSSMREEMMPCEKAYPIQQVVKTCNEYRSRSGRRITYEYSVIEGLNDTQWCADGIYRLLKGTDAHINLIDINVGNGRYKENKTHAIFEFAKKLEQLNINYTIRRKLGSSINAACGQLISKFVE